MILAFVLALLAGAALAALPALITVAVFELSRLVRHLADRRQQKRNSRPRHRVPQRLLEARTVEIPVRIGAFPQ